MRPARSSSAAPASRTWTLRAPARFSRSKIGASRARSLSVAKTWPLLPIERGQRQRLAAGAGAEVEHLLARAGADHQRGDLAALVLHLEPALLEGRLVLDIGVAPLAVGGGDAQAVGRERRRGRAEAGERLQDLRPVGLQPVDAHVERRDGAPAPRPRRPRSSPKRRSKRGASHSGMSARTWSGAPARSAAARRRASSSVSGSGAWGSSANMRRQSVGAEAPAPADGRQCQRPRRVGIHRPRRPTGASASRHRRCCRSRRDRRSRRSDGRRPNPSAPRQPGGDARRSRPEPRSPRQAARPVSRANSQLQDRRTTVAAKISHMSVRIGQRRRERRRSGAGRCWW